MSNLLHKSREREPEEGQEEDEHQTPDHMKLFFIH